MECGRDADTHTQRWPRAGPALACLLVASLLGCSSEDVTTFSLSSAFYDGDALRQLVLHERSRVSSDWFSHGFQVSDQRSQRWVVHWKMLDSTPFIDLGHIEKGPWLEGDRIEDRLLGDGTVMKSHATVNEADLLAAGLIARAQCADVEPRRVAYNRARGHFVILCERGLVPYRVGEPHPVSGMVDASRLREFLSGDTWHAGTRLSLSHDSRRLAIWRGVEIPGISPASESISFHEVVLVDLRSGEMTRTQLDLPASVRILEVEVDSQGEVQALLCSSRGAAGWKLAVTSAKHGLRQVPAPSDTRGCSPHDRVTWIPERELVLFIKHPQVDGHVHITAHDYARAESASTDWRLPKL